MNPADYSSLPPPDDMMDEVGPEWELPPNWESALSCLEADISDTWSDVNQILTDELLSAEGAIAQETSAVNVAVASLIGSTDQQLRESLALIFKPIDKQMDLLLRELAAGEDLLRQHGAQIPMYSGDLITRVNDPTGEGILSQLPGYAAEPAPDTMIEPDDAGLPVIQDGTVGDVDGMIPSPPVLPPPPPPPPPPPFASGECITVERQYDPISGYTWGWDGALIRDDGKLMLPTSPSGPFSGPTTYCPAPDVPPATLPPPPSEEPPTLPPPPPDEPHACDCPSPPLTPEPLPAGYRTTGEGVIWASRDICERLHEATRVPSSPIDDTSGDERERLSLDIGLADILQTIAAPGVSVLNALGITGNETAEASVLSQLGAIGLGFGVVQPIWATLDPRFVPDREATSVLAARLAIAETAADYAQIPMDYLMQGERYMMQYLAPQYLPSQGELDSAYLTDQINVEQWTCLTRSLGNVPEPAQWAITAQSVRPDVRTLIDLYRRGVIQSRDTLIVRARQMGVLHAQYVDELEESMRAIPTPPDLVRFMVRDALDENVARKYSYDYEFEDKLYGAGGKDNPGPVAAWMRANGVTEDVMRMYWRSHWEIPSRTLLEEMLHRLRPDRPEYEQYERAVIQWELTGRDGPAPAKPPVATYDDVRDAVVVDDMAPGWVDRVLAVSYHPMTRTDAINAYMANVRDEKWLYHRFRDNGYDDPTAREMVDIQKMIRSRRVANVSGVWTVRRISKEYKDGSINRARAFELLESQIPDIAQRNAVLDGADTEVSARVMQTDIKGIKRAVFTGYYTAERANEALRALGVDPARANQLTLEWDILRRTRYKEPSGKWVMDWLGKGIITVEQAYQRLINLGYQPTDANIMAQRGLRQLMDESERKMVSIQREQERAIKTAKEAKRAGTKDLKERQDALARILSEAQAEYARIGKVLDSRT